MIGLVVVSHNRKLAEEIINFSNEMKQFDFPVENGGGTSSEIYGTEPQIIIDAIKRADKGEGVLIFVDLGSSIMNTEMAIEILGSPEKLYIVDAPAGRRGNISCSREFSRDIRRRIKTDI